MSDKELVDKIVMFRTELERQNAGMGIMSLFDTICSYYGEQHRTIKSQKEEIEKLTAEVKYQVELTLGFNQMHTDISLKLSDKNAEVESLKAITELAVKGLQFYASFWNHEVQLEDVGITSMKRDGGKMARTTLSEIERLQNEKP